MTGDLLLEPGFATCPSCDGDGKTVLSSCARCQGKGWVPIGFGWQVYEDRDPLSGIEPKGGTVVDILTTDIDTETGEIYHRLRFVTISPHRGRIVSAIVPADEAAEIAVPPNVRKLRALVKALHAELAGRRSTSGPWEARLEGYCHRLSAFVVTGEAA